MAAVDSDKIDLQRQLADFALKNSELQVQLARLKERNQQLEALLSKHGITIPHDYLTTEHQFAENGQTDEDFAANGQGDDEADLGAKEAAAEILNNYAPMWQAGRHQESPLKLDNDGEGSTFSPATTAHVNGVNHDMEPKPANGTASTPTHDQLGGSLPRSPTSLSNKPKLQLHLQYSSKKEQLAIEVLQGEQLAVLGVLDFSKVYFKFDLVPGRLISARSGSVLFAPNTPLNATVVLSVRQTSLRWKKLALTVWSVDDVGSEACMGTGHVELKDLQKDVVEVTPWIDVVADEDERQKKDDHKKRTISSSVLPKAQPEETQLQPRSHQKVIRRHTVSSAEGLNLQMTAETSGRVSSTSPPQRMFQRRRMAAAVMQAARSESAKEGKPTTPDGSTNTAERKTSWTRASPAASLTSPITPSASSSVTTSTNSATQERKTSWARAATLSTEKAEPVTSSGAVTGMASAAEDDDIPDIRSLNRSRTGGQSLPSTPLKKAVAAFQSPLAASQPKRASLGSMGRAASMDSLLARRHLSSTSSTEDLTTVVKQDRIVKEVLAEEQDERLPVKEKATADGDAGDNQFLERLNHLRSSQRKKPEGLSFRQKQAFFRTASVDLPDADKSRK